jgi:tetratricopeptide (TPR) repeat protein
MASKTKNPAADALIQQAIDLYQRGNADAAIALLQNAGKRFRSSAKLWGYLGFLQKERGSFTKAADCFHHAVEISPASEKASLGLFFSLYRAGKARDAIDEMLRYLRCGQPIEYVQLLRHVLTRRNTHRSVMAQAEVA